MGEYAQLVEKTTLPEASENNCPSAAQNQLRSAVPDHTM